MNFQEKLVILRKEKGLSQEELAEQLGISRQAVAKWELGQSYPEIDNMIALSNLFKITIDRLLKSEGDCSLQFMKDKQPTTKGLLEFLLKAKTNTYAANGTLANSCRISSHDYKYSEGEYHYLDSYFGGEKFIGEEVVWKNQIPAWSMNYTGRVLGEGFSGDFLKEALKLVPAECPYRGPSVYHKGDYSYHCIVNGSFEWYQGYEEIFLHNEKVYECYFHGGSIQ